MWQAPSPTASVISDAMAPPFRSSETERQLVRRQGECRRSLTHIRIPGQGKMVQEDAAAAAALPHLVKKREQASFQPSSGRCWVISLVCSILAANRPA